MEGEGDQRPSCGNNGGVSAEDEEDAKDRGSSTESAFSNPTENELINLDEFELSDEDTWLYTSPSAKTSEENDLSPYKWLRKDIEDPNKRELQLAKTALVNKLDELEILKSVQRAPDVTLQSLEEKPFERDAEEADLENDSYVSSSENALTINNTSSTDHCTENQISPLSSDTSASEAAEVDKKQDCGKHQPYTDVMDIFERARLQEESLKESSSKFFNQTTRTFPRGTRASMSHSGRTAGLPKPASIEVLRANSEDLNSSVPSSLNCTDLSADCSSLSPFGSTVSLSHNPESHRSSLPNLNKGFYTLKCKKPKRISEAQVQCPLPAYPRLEAFQAASHLNGTNSDSRETRTLPSSYRSKSRGSVNSCSTLPRRDSAPGPRVPRSLMKNSRQDSVPSIVQMNDVPSSKLQPHQLASRKNSAPTGHQVVGLSSSLQSLKSVSLNHLPRDPRISPIKEYLRQPSQTHVKRQPLSSMHNYSPEKDECAVVQRNGDLKKSSLSSKIPCTVQRSGIPVPSSHFVGKPNQVPRSWDKDFY